MRKTLYIILALVILSSVIAINASQEFSNRIPTAYVVVTGAGQSNYGIPPDPYETFSYDIALKEAGIENFNVVYYTSVLSPESYEVPFDSVKNYFHHGAVLETIMAKAFGIKGDTVVAGVARVWAQDEKGKYIGGFAAEYEKVYKNSKIDTKTLIKNAKKELTLSLQNVLKIRNLKQKGNIKYNIKPLNITKKYGITLAAIAFINYKYPDPIPTSKMKED
jgi:pyruvoyl-dependent arginine decarboxylase (PvlArgDC)